MAITAAFSYISLALNWLRDDLSKARQEVSTIRGEVNELKLVGKRMDLLVEKLDERAARQLEYFCVAYKGSYDGNSRRCTFVDGRPALQYLSLEK